MITSVYVMTAGDDGLLRCGTDMFAATTIEHGIMIGTEVRDTRCAAGKRMRRIVDW